METDGTVFVVDDDDGVRKAIQSLLESVGLKALAYDNAEEFLERYVPGTPGCLVLDIRMPGMSGMELQRRLAEVPDPPPIVFLTGHGDVPLAVQAMQAGAFGFLEKPFREHDLLDRVHRALQHDAAARAARSELRTIEERHQRLTPREREVLDGVVRGDPNKAIAMDLGISERTVEVHRAQVMRKMEADSIAKLVEMVLRLQGGRPAGSGSGGA